MKTALITGGSAGIGKETAKELARLGFDIIIAARDAAKGESVVSEIRAECPQAKVEFISLDLTDFPSVKDFASSVRSRWHCLDLLILNAGLFTPKLKLSESGHEFMFATTHLGHFLLTHELLPLMKTSNDGRIVVTSSVAHKLGSLINFLDFENPSSNSTLLLVPFINYGRSKLCNLLFVRALASRLAGTTIKVNAFHPGAVKSEIWRSTPGLFNSALSPFLVSERKGAQTQIYLATDPQLKTSGEYWYRQKIARTSGPGKDSKLANKLWKYSENALGIKNFGEPEATKKNHKMESN